MKCLVDNSLSPSIARGLTAAGFDAAHVCDYDLQAAADEVIFERAEAEGRTILAADSDSRATLLNAVPAIVRAEPGLRTILDLPLPHFGR